MNTSREELESIKRNIDFDRWLAEKLAQKAGDLSEIEINRYKSMIYKEVDSRMADVLEEWEND